MLSPPYKKPKIIANTVVIELSVLFAQSAILKKRLISRGETSRKGFSFKRSDFFSFETLEVMIRRIFVN